MLPPSEDQAMPTDAPNQHDIVIAKDLLIAALEAKQLHLRSANAVHAATELGDAYSALLKAMRAQD